jgi:hypothetical protein
MAATSIFFFCRGELKGLLAVGEVYNTVDEDHFKSID